MKKLMTLIIAISSSISVFAQHPENDDLDLNNDKSIRWKDSNGTWRSQLFTTGNVFQVTPMGSGVRLFFGDGTSSDSDLWFAKTVSSGTPSTPFMVVKENGRVGIGHGTPDMKLDVRSDGEFVTRFHHNGTSHISGVRVGRNASYGDLVVLPTGFGIGAATSGTSLPLNSQSSNDLDFFISNSTGNVGIGIGDPKSRLSVDGDIFFNNRALVTAQSADGTNIDHMWHDDAAAGGAGGTWNFTSDGTYKKAGNSRLRAGHVYMVGTNSTSYFAGNVGIGTTDADMKLTVQGHVNVGGTGNARVKTRHIDGKSHTSADFGNLYLNYASNYPVIVGNTGNAVDMIVYGEIICGSTTIPSGYKMAIAGKAIMEEVKVQIKSAWPDYVFTPSYNLQSLSEVESFINENGHLPNIPSASEVEENNGIELGAMNARLLEKIEELTLHLINKDKQVTNLEQQNAQLEATLTQVLERLEKIESSVEK
ncbi:MAG: hypothetical protein NXI20_07300 [bacterium]|nr:hypothetical protein [bacterium]